MVLSGVTEAAPAGIQRLIVGAISTVGIVLAIATTSHADTSSITPATAAQTTASTAQQTHTHTEQITDTAATAAEIEAAADRAGLERLRARLLAPKTTAEALAPPAHGTYHYGQQPIADQPETAYFVFESQGATVTGALYMPSSSFDCVQGRIIDQQMALSITDSYSQETYPYALTLNEPIIQVASQNGLIASPPNIDGFYPLPLRAQDRAILATCQAI